MGRKPQIPNLKQIPSTKEGMIETFEVRGFEPWSLGFGICLSFEF